MKAAVLAMAVSAPFLTGRAAEGDFEIAVRGQGASCPIVVPAAPSACVQYAAEELRDYTERMTGVRLAIETNTAPARAVRLGVREDGLGPEGFRIAVDAQGVRIGVSEGTGVGALYGVYELLETYGGVGWFSSWTTVVPTADRLAVPLGTDVRQKPAFAVRQPFFWDVNTHPEFGAKLRRNNWSWCGKIPERLGGDRFRSGAGLYGHSFSILLPPEKYFKDHPEYFSEVRGKRLGRNSQLCLTNPDVFRIVASNLLAAIRRDPGGYRYAVTHNDNQNYCTCAKCRAVCEEEGSLAGPDIRFVNAIADLVAKEFPGKILSTSAYQYTRKPPRTAPRPNVTVSLCPIECEHSLPLDGSPCEKNRRFVEDMRGWARLTRNLAVFDYVANFENYLGPYPDVYSLQGNLRFFRDNGVRGVYEEGDHCGGHGDFSELKAWLLGKWLWDPELPVGPLLDRFFNGYYGNAAPLVRTYFDELHALPRDAAVHPLYTYTDYFDPAISDGFLSHALNLWKKAERLVADDPVRAYNVRMGEMSVAYMILRRGEKRIAVSREAYPSADLRRLAAWMLERVAEAGANGISKVPNRGVCFFEGGYVPSRGDRDAKMCAKWRQLADPAFTLPPADRAVREIEDVFDRYPGNGCKVVDDPAAAGGKSMLVPLYRSADWMLHMTMRAFKADRGTTYRLRLRARAEPKPGASEVGVFSAGIHGACSREFTTSQVSGEYRWYDIGEFRDIGTDRTMFIARGVYDAKKYGGNPASDNVWVDQIEIVAVSPSADAQRTVYSYNLGRGLGDWTFVNYDNALVLTNVAVHGERALKLVKRADRRSTAFALKSPVFDLGGAKGAYALEVRFCGTNRWFFTNADRKYGTFIQWFDRDGKEVPGLRTFGFDCDLSRMSATAVCGEIPPGAAKARISIGADSAPQVVDGQFVAVSRVEFTAYPAPTSSPVRGTSLRDDGVTLLDGKPFFPIGIYRIFRIKENGFDYRTAFRELKAAGFNTVHTYDYWSSSSFCDFLDAADDTGMKLYIPCAEGNGNYGFNEKYVLAARNRKSLLAWYLADDTCLHVDKRELLWRHTACKRLDPYHLTLHADAAGGECGHRFGAYLDCTDVFAPEVYPVQQKKPTGREVRDAYASARVVRDTMVAAGHPRKASWPIIQYFDGWAVWNRFPSRDELRAMTYSSIAGGARGILFYAYSGAGWKREGRWARGVRDIPEKWDDICGLTRELDALKDALVARDAKAQPTVSCDRGEVVALLKDHGAGLLIAANITTNAVRATFGLAGVKGATVRFENGRRIAGQDGFSDDFAPYGTHVYELKK